MLFSIKTLVGEFDFAKILDLLVEYTGQGFSNLKNGPDPTPSENGVVIKVHATGICRSDWYGWMTQVSNKITFIH